MYQVPNNGTALSPLWSLLRQDTCQGQATRNNSVSGVFGIFVACRVVLGTILYYCSTWYDTVNVQPPETICTDSAKKKLAVYCYWLSAQVKRTEEPRG